MSVSVSVSVCVCVCVCVEVCVRQVEAIGGGMWLYIWDVVMYIHTVRGRNVYEEATFLS